MAENSGGEDDEKDFAKAETDGGDELELNKEEGGNKKENEEKTNRLTNGQKGEKRYEMTLTIMEQE